jgi:glycerate kinase
VRALLCPASLKGVLSARAAAAALAFGIRGVGAEAVEVPIADGGEGTGDVLAATLGGTWHATRASDPLGRPVDASWLELADGRAVVEAASAIGLPLLAPAERDPLRASSRGFGELVSAALERSPSGLVLTLGGVATVDGGAGLLEVLQELPVPAIALCDVRSRLADAARLYGPQKGAAPAQVDVLERRLLALERLRPFGELEGSGAAGGLGAALASLGAELVPGAATVLDLVGLDAQLGACDLVVTGEGRVDRTTLEGKAPAEVVRRAAERGVRCVVFGGQVEVQIPGAETVALSGDPDRAKRDLIELGRRLGEAPNPRTGSG